MFGIEEEEVTDDHVWEYLQDEFFYNRLCVTYCRLNADGLPDEEWETGRSQPIYFTYKRVGIGSE